MTALLLDTCALLWLVNGDEMTGQSHREIGRAVAEKSLFISPMSAWEIATLIHKGRLALSMAPEPWFERVLALPGIKLVEMPPRTLIASAFLPGDPPADPADRILIATARAENLVLVTRDRKLLAYAAAGHVRGLEC